MVIENAGSTVPELAFRLGMSKSLIHRIFNQDQERAKLGKESLFMWDHAEARCRRWRLRSEIYDALVGNKAHFMAILFDYNFLPPLPKS